MLTAHPNPGYSVVSWGDCTIKTPNTCLVNFTPSDSELSYSSGVAAVSMAQPTMISDCNGLQNMKSNLLGNYALSQNIDCKNFNGTQGFMPIGTQGSPFRGSLTGLSSDGKTVYQIQNLTINQPTISVGLFSEVLGSNSTGAVKANIHDLALTKVNVQGGGVFLGDASAGSAGALAGSAYEVSISRVSITGVIVGTSAGGGLGSIGGVVGNLGEHGFIDQVSAIVAVQGNAYNLGGIAGDSEGIISQSFANVTINAKHGSAVCGYQ